MDLDTLFDAEDEDSLALIEALQAQQERQQQERAMLGATLGRQQQQAGGLRTLSLLSSLGANPLLAGVQRASGEQGAQLEGLASRTEQRLAQQGPGIDPVRVASLRQAAERLRLAREKQTGAGDRFDTMADLARQRLALARQKLLKGAEERAGREATQQESGLRKELMGNPVTKNFLEASVAFDKVRNAAEDPSAAGDLALIFGYMKTLDPGSTVREGEFATAQNAAGVDERVASLYNRVLQGTRLTAAQRADFVKSAEGQLNAQRAAYEQLAKQYEGLASPGSAQRVSLPGLKQMGARPEPQRVPAARALPKDAAGQPTLDGPALPPPPPGKVRVRMGGKVGLIPRENLEAAKARGAVEVP